MTISQIDHAVLLQAAQEVARRLERDPHAADDLAQVVLAKYLDAWPEGSPDNLEAWLTTATRRSQIDLARRAHRRDRGRVRAQDDDRDPIELVATSSRASLQPLQDDLIARVMDLVSPRDMEVLEMRLLQDRSTSEIGQALGISKTAAEQRLTRATRRLRDALEIHPDLVEALRLGHPRRD